MNYLKRKSYLPISYAVNSENFGLPLLVVIYGILLNQDFFHSRLTFLHLDTITGICTFESVDRILHWKNSSSIETANTYIMHERRYVLYVSVSRELFASL